jgi:hypothetical protein
MTDTQAGADVAGTALGTPYEAIPGPGERGVRRRPRVGAVNISGLVRRHYWLLPAIVVGVLVPLIVALATGALSIPHNDGWAYSRIAQNFAKTGHLTLVGWNRSALIGQFIVLGPLAASITVQQLYVVVLGLIGLICVYDLLRPSLGSRNAGIAALMLALWPGFGLLDTSFMTDIPAMTASFLCMALGRRALERDSSVLFTVAVLAGFWGTTIRAQALAAPAALLIYAAFTWRSRTKVRLLLLAAISLVFAVAFAYFNSWFEALPGGDLPPYKLVKTVLNTSLDSSLLTYYAVALPAAPAVFWAAKPSRWGRGAKLTSAAAGVISLVAVHDFRRSIFTGNYLTPRGAYPTTSFGTRFLIPNHLWDLLILIAVASGTLLAGLIVHKVRHADKLVVTFTLAFAAGTIGTFVLGELFYERYLIEILPGVLAVALLPETAPARRTAALPFGDAVWRQAAVPIAWARRACALGTAVVVALVGLMLLTNSLTSDEQHWKAAQALQAQGVPAMRIEADLEWLGMHAPHGVVNRGGNGTPIGYFTNTPACYAFSESRKPNGPHWTIDRVITYDRYLVAGSVKLYIYATHAAGCGG